MALSGIEQDDPLQEHLEQVLRATEKSSTLVRQLLTFSRSQPYERRQIDLDQIITDSLKLTRRVLGEHIELVSQSSEDPKWLRADPSRIEQLLMNLCTNARDSMPDGGVIVIETDVVRFSEEYCTENAWAREGEYVSLTVADTGKGIPLEIQDRVFDPFFTTKEIGSGTGLGLATTYEIVRRHDGFLKLESEPDKGSRFRLFFLLTRAAIVAEPESNADTEVVGGSETILYAEDEDVIRELGTHILGSAGYFVLACVDGEEAIRIAMEKIDDIDIAILDLVMTKIGGRAVFDAIREKEQTMPILFTSGYSFEILNKEMLDEVSVSLLSKPHTSKELLRSVRSLLDT